MRLGAGLLVEGGIDDGDSGLVGDGVEQFHFAHGEQATFAAHRMDHADHLVAGMHRHAERGGHPGRVDGRGAVARIGGYIRDGLWCLPLVDPAGDAFADTGPYFVEVLLIHMT